MKKLIVLSILSLLSLSILPTLATCSIETGDTICSLSNFRQENKPIYKQNPNNVAEFSSNPEGRLQPVERADPTAELRRFSNVEKDYNYNTSCQFGVCLDNRNEPLFNK